MDTEFSVVIDVREVASRLSFLVGRTILFRNGYGDAATATQVVAVKAENTPVTCRPCVTIYTTVGVQTITDSDKFNDIFLVGENGEVTPLGNLGIVFSNPSPLQQAPVGV